MRDHSDYRVQLFRRYGSPMTAGILLAAEIAAEL